MKMQDTANSSTNPNPDQPSGQFSADDIEFEAFMFDPGTGPLPSMGSLNTDPNLGVTTAVNPLAADLAAPRGTGPLSSTAQAAVPAPSQPAAPAPAFDFAGEDVPLPPFLAGSEAEAQQQAGPEQPYQAAPQDQTVSPRGTGPLGLGAQHGGSHLAARLSQLQGDTAPTRGTGPLGGVPSSGTGPLGMRRGTGPLGGVPSSGTGPLGTGAAASTAGPQPAPQGPINPAYFKTPTGPLNQRIRTGPLTAGGLRPEPEQPVATTPQTGTLFGSLRTYPEQTPGDPNTWNDTTLSSVEDFSQILLALQGLPSNLPPMMAQAPSEISAMSASTAVQERTETTQEWAGLPFENAYSASAGPALTEPPLTQAEEAPVPGWGDMTGAPPESSYTGTYGEVATPGYDGPQIDYLVPLEETEVPTPATGMDSFLQPPDDFEAESPQMAAPTTEAQAEAPEMAQAELEPTAEETEGGPLPFWLQDTSDLEAVARQGYVDLRLGTETAAEEAQAGEPLAMQTAEPIAPPEPEQYEPEAVVVVVTEITEEAGEVEETTLVAVVDLEPTTEEDFAAVEELDVAPFDASMVAVQPETETVEEEAGLDLAPTYQAETYMEPQQELEAEPAMELQAEPQIEADTDVEQTTKPAAELDYEDLPPIEPFDFTSLNMAPEEDEYGFNADELLGVMPSTKDPMRATANLDVLADIFDGAPIGSAEDMNTTYNTAASLDTGPMAETSKRTPTSPALSQLTSPIASFLEDEGIETEETATQSQLQAQLRAQMDAQAHAATPAEPQAEVETEEPVEPAAPQPVSRETGRLSGGWTSAVTTTLSMEGMDDLDRLESIETGMLIEPATVEPAAEPVAAEPVAAAQPTGTEGDFDIEPFDYTQLKLEEEPEIPTGMLDPRRARRPGSTGELISPDRGGSLWTESPATPAEEEEGDEESWQGTERDTSLFMSTSPRLADRGKSTGWLTDDSATRDEIQAAGATNTAPYTPTPEPTDTPEEPAAEVQTGGRQGKGRKKGAADDSSAVKARVTWADATSPSLPTLPDDMDLPMPSMTTGPLEPETEETGDVEATVPQSGRQTKALKPTPEAAPTAPADEVEPEPAPKRSRSKAATAATAALTPEPVQEVEPELETEPEPVTASPIAPVDVPEYTYQPMQGYQETPQQVEMPKVGTGRDMYTSGPLPELEGFEALRQIVEANPDDIGAHMALAAGYSQLGDLSTTLRVYRRVLRRRTIPAMFLSLIAEELNDYERELQGNPHYHQVRGDLYMKQGRHQEAILEYNKIS